MARQKKQDQKPLTCSCACSPGCLIILVALAVMWWIFL